LGLDPYQLDDETSNEILDAAARLPNSLQDEVLKAAPPNQLASSINWIEAGLAAIQSNAVVDGKWNALRDRLPREEVHREQPWQGGYRLASMLRDILGITNVVEVKLDELMESPLPMIAAPAPPAASFDGLVGMGNGSLCCYTAKRHSDSRRFLFARGLVGFLFDKSDSVDFYSSAQTSFQQRNRAFAAEFLAPAALIHKRLSSDDISNHEVEELAAQFQVSALVIEHQIINHRLGTING
jgi:hypothetical protein